MGALSHLADFYELQSDILLKTKQTEDAIYYLRESHKLKDSLFSTKKAQQVEELKTIYETEKNKAQIALQKEEINTLNAQAENDKLTKTLYGIGMFSFISISGLLFLLIQVNALKKTELNVQNKKKSTS
jgi:hypothetical protein